MQQIRNYDLLSKEDLIYALLRSRNPNEDIYISRITSALDTNILDNEIKLKIKDIKQLVTRVRNLLTNKERNKVTKELYDLLKRVNNKNRNTILRKKQKENILLRVIEQHNYLSENERFMDIDYDDLQY